jgi:hypothetical protein
MTIQVSRPVNFSPHPSISLVSEIPYKNTKGDGSPRRVSIELFESTNREEAIKEDKRCGCWSQRILTLAIIKAKEADPKTWGSIQGGN